MIPHLDIEAEYSNVRFSCLIDIEKDDKLVMPSILFFKSKEAMGNGKDFSSIDNPSYIFTTFVEFLEKYLLDKLSVEDREYHEDVIQVVTTYQQAKELLDIIKWIKSKGVEQA